MICHYYCFVLYADWELAKPVKILAYAGSVFVLKSPVARNVCPARRLKSLLCSEIPRNLVP